MPVSQSSTDTLRDFGRRLYEVIDATGLSQNEFSHRINTSPSFVSAMVRGDKMPGAEFLMAVKRYYRVSTDWLLDGNGSMYVNHHLDMDSVKLSAALVYLAFIWETEGDQEAAALGEGILDGSVQIDNLSPDQLALIRAYEQGMSGAAATAYIYNEHRMINDPNERVVAIMRSARAQAQYVRPLRLPAKPGMGENTGPRRESSQRLA